AVSGCSAVTVYEPIEYQSYYELSPQAINWGFVKNKNAAPDISADDAALLEAYDGYYIDETKPKAIYLTFDEGYENGYTSKILDILQAQNVKAAFFVTGPYLESQGDLIRRMLDEGHIVGNHTVNHINMAQADAETVKAELDGLSQKCEELYGVGMKYVRPPEGTFSERSLAVCRDMGYKTVLWSFAYKDWDVNAQQGGEYAVNQITPYFHDGEIMLLHAVSSDNAAALEEVIRLARERGYEFRSLDEL
ncbi:MAG: delta-lactam-biosynthetic de-N-acetylase, partial [Firmicutes bacterium]|nr:delta-lactam-biosynthetic de-N-acetylase [Bacillota bacterium]